MCAKEVIIRDPIHDMIVFSANDMDDQLLYSLINTKEFQRLRRIKQLGFSELTYPGANHSRFSHSLGAMQLARRMLSHLEKEIKIDPKDRTIMLCAALLHDVGHGPYSHAFEKISKIDHEQRTRDIIEDESTEIHNKLIEFTKDESIPNLIARVIKDDEEKPPVPRFLISIVSSQLDADRFDYLMRDCHFGGVVYGQYDFRWLLHHLQMDKRDQRLYLENKALQATEQYIYARYNMYSSVYFHKTTRSAEVLLSALFDRIKELKADNKDTFNDWDIPNYLKSILRQDKAILLNDFLLMDDNSVNILLRGADQSNDNISADYARRIINRDLLKCYEVKDQNISDLRDSELKEKVKNGFSKNGEFDFKYYWREDRTKNVPYKLKAYEASSPEGRRAPYELIYIENEHGQIEEISNVSPLVKQLTERVQKQRYYFPSEMRSKIVTICEEVLEK